ncbi:MAG: M14 family metallopeptidase [Bdellovibrionota bacterium]|nr:M14 family metallopeptidase [Bdellovibrionota bacterium]
MIKKIMLLSIFTSFVCSAFAGKNVEGEKFWMKLKATNKAERTELLNAGLAIEHGIHDDYAILIGNKDDLEAAKNTGKLIEHFKAEEGLFDFPSKDSNFHNYEEMLREMEAIRALNPNIVQLENIGTTHEGRMIVNIKISGNMRHASQLPAIVFTGTHHAREHLSTEMPLMLARALVEGYNSQNFNLQNLVNSREINIIPMVNPDGVEHDIADGDYKMWRKNRRNNGDGTYGVDLNRNYGYLWGTGGSSKRTSSDVYMGPEAFSEPETQAIKAFVENKPNITTLLSFHTFSELILYPWGHTDAPIANERDRQVHEIMANRMSQWNNYTPQASSDLYITSGDTTDWAYGEHGIISFTFELDPKSMWSGGFYPGQSKIPVVFNKNINPCLYLIEFADNPYRVLQSRSKRLGFTTDFLDY